jgi:hypothetical protein
MENEAFKKRLEESARPTAPEPKESTKIGRPKYFTSLIRPKDPRKKSEITLYACLRR